MAANKIQTLVFSVAVKSPVDKLYNFFKYDMNDLVKVFPAVFKGVKIIEGEEGKVGCVKLWNYILGVTPMTANAKTEVIDDAGKMIKWAAVEGDVLLLYKSFVLSLSISEGLIEWKIEYEGATLLTPPPELYIPLLTTAATLVDAYLLIN